MKYSPEGDEDEMTNFWEVPWKVLAEILERNAKDHFNVFESVSDRLFREMYIDKRNALMNDDMYHWLM